MSTWLILTATLPTSPSGLRVRVWRSLKATGAGTLREGVYVLPEHAATAAALRALEHTIRQAGAEAHLLLVPARDDAQQQSFQSLFDRREAYAEVVQAIKTERAALKKASELQLRKALRTLGQQLQAVQAIDFFPGPEGRKAADALAAFRRELERQLSPGEPRPADAPIEPRAIGDYQGCTWATRKRPWVDRLATAWLVQRFIDRTPRFVWLADPKKCPKSALGYDFGGATFTHLGDRVTFEVVAESFALLADPGLRRLAALVHFIDVGGIPVDEAPGVEALVRGLQALHARDDALLAAALPLFDSLYAALHRTDEP
jgi:hypothetical protein